MKTKVSIDFDGTLTRPSVQRFAKELVERGFDVWICTHRKTNEIAGNPHYNDELFEIADKVGIKRENIQFMNMEDKFPFFIENNDFIWHLDDDWIELDMINKNTNVIGISVFGNDKWKLKCEKVMLKHLKQKQK